VKKTKPITLLLLLFLLLLIFCTWCYIDEISEKRELRQSATEVQSSTPSIHSLVYEEKVIPTTNVTAPIVSIKSENSLTPTKTIFYSIRKENNQLTLEGTVVSVEQEELLTTAIKNENLVKAINIEPQLIPSKEDLLFTQKLLKIFNSDYSEGFISYQDGTFTVGGVVKNETVKIKMTQLLQSHSNNFNNYTKVERSKEDLKEKEEALAYQKAKKKKEQELEKQKIIAEALQLEKEQEALNKVKEEIKLKELRKKEAEILEDDIKLILDSEHIRFKSSQSVLTSNSKETIKKIALLLGEHPTVKIEISGHTDSSGDAKRNLKLSQSRVNAVENALIKLNISSDRLKAVGYGEEQPLVSNDSKENREINRRVEFKIIGE